LEEVIEKYIRSIEHVCGEEKQFIVTLNYEVHQEAIQKIISKSKIVSTVAGILLKLEYKSKELKVTGNKILVKDVQDASEVKKLLSELLS
jgi:hypothetical protein